MGMSRGVDEGGGGAGGGLIRGGLRLCYAPGEFGRRGCGGGGGGGVGCRLTSVVLVLRRGILGEYSLHEASSSVFCPPEISTQPTRAKAERRWRSWRRCYQPGSGRSITYPPSHGGTCIPLATCTFPSRPRQPQHPLKITLPSIHSPPIEGVPRHKGNISSI